MGTGGEVWGPAFPSVSALPCVVHVSVYRDMKKQLLLLLGISGSFDGFVLHLTEKRLPKASRRRGIPVVPMRSCPRVRVVHLRKIEYSVLMISDKSGHAETYRVLTMVRKEGAPPQ